MTEAAKLIAELDAAYNAHSFTPGDPICEFLPRIMEALRELDERQKAPQFIAIPRVSRHGPEVKRDGE